MTERACIGCGCSDTNACRGGCSWAFESGLPTLGICTNCVDEFDDPEEALREATTDALADNDSSDVDLGDSDLILPGDPEYFETLRGGRRL